MKFVEAFWRALFYTGFVYLGAKSLFYPEIAPWITNTVEMWEDWPNFQISGMLLFYYQFALGCYIHQLLWTEVTRSDAVEMILHHFITIALIVCSYLTGFTKVGSIIILLHDIADIFLETAKVFNYCSQKPGYKWLKAWIVDPMFGVFAVSFFLTRLVYYPYNIIGSVVTEGWGSFTCTVHSCWFFVFLLSALQLLHVFWFYLIVRMIWKLLMGTMVKDERSDDDEEIDYDNDDLDTKKDN